MSRQFKEVFIYNQEHIKKILPTEILRMIADIRVYVLDKASRQVIKDVTRFCEDNEKLVNRTITEYNNYYKKALKSFDKDMIENIHFHDCVIIDKSKQSRLYQYYLIIRADLLIFMKCSLKIIRY
ncbi:DUF4085 domain-containing protein [Clostridium tagluense]|nr:DUF4085 domain-containing protein [Clostridium tagluense]